MIEKCGSMKGIENKLEQLVDVANSYIKSKENQDARWTVTREQGNKLSVLENKIKDLDDNLNSVSDTRPGVIIQFKQMIVRNEANFISLKEDLRNFKSFIMKIIYTITGGIAAIIALGSLIAWIINIANN